MRPRLYFNLSTQTGTQINQVKPIVTSKGTWIRVIPFWVCVFAFASYGNPYLTIPPEITILGGVVSLLSVIIYSQKQQDYLPCYIAGVGGFLLFVFGATLTKFLVS